MNNQPNPIFSEDYEVRAPGRKEACIIPVLEIERLSSRIERIEYPADIFQTLLGGGSC